MTRHRTVSDARPFYLLVAGILGCVRERFLDLRYQPKAKKVEIVSCVKISAVRERFLNLENDIWSK